MFIDRRTLRLGLASQMLDELFVANDPDLELITTWFMDQNMVTFEDKREDHQSIWFETPVGKIGSGVMFVSNWEHFASDPSILDPESDFEEGPWGEAPYRLERYKFLKAAEMRDMDFFVTDSKFLLEYTPERVWGTNVISSEEAIAIIGSHLRNRGNYLIEMTTDGWFKRNLDRISFYWIVRLAILGPISLGETLTNESSHQNFKILSALAYRCEQMLKSRDHALTNLLQPQNNQTLDEALYFFDMFLLTMGGMFDALAKIADVLLGLKSNERSIGWNKEKWLKKVENRDRRLSQLVAEGSRWRSVLKLHSILRNTIHGEQMDSMHYQNARGPQQSLFVLTGDDADSINCLLQGLGGPETWGTVPSNNNDLWLGIGPTMECLLAESIRFTIETIMHLGAGTGERRSSLSVKDRPFDEETLCRATMLAGCYQLREERLQFGNSS
jgi:hypothetical protein